MKTTARAVSATLIGCLAIAIAAPATAADKIEEGKALYKEHCKVCHDVDSAHGEYTPMTLIQDQWQRFFDRKYERKHKSVIDEAHGGKPVTEVISPESLELIKAFAIAGAADSDQPMTCD